jgi:DNA-binding CsgD family transcriptional regulator
VIVGRESELARVHEFVDETLEEPAALLLDGDAGIGKSTLWLEGVEHARGSGFRILASRPAEAERGLAYVGLGDLFEPVLDDVLPKLAPPRRRALEVALLLEEATADAVDGRAVGIAMLSALQLLARGRRLLVAIDDLQWFDAPSTRALVFALRRLDAEDVHLLLARRIGLGALPAELEQAFAPESIRRLTVGPLTVGALHRILHDRLGKPFARQTLLQIHERSGGNPFFALELARLLDAEAGPAFSPAVPATLEELLRARISGLPAATRNALAFASALGTASRSTLEQAGFSAEVLEPAAGARVIEDDTRTVRFTHPLLASVLYNDLGQARPRLHARIAEIVADPLVRARHLALSKDAPDADLAALVDEAVVLAGDRGASAVAAELAEHALRLTPPEVGVERRRRALAAARAHQVAGEWTRARAIATDLLSEPEAGTERAEALILLSELEGTGRAAELLEEALAEAASRPALQSLIHCRLAWAIRFRSTYDHALAALELAEQADDDLLRARAGAVQAILSWFVGRSEAPDDLAERAQLLPGALGGQRLVQEATQAVVNTHAPSSRRDEARALLEREEREWHDRDEPRSARALWGLAWVEFWAGRWELAAELAARAHEIAIQYGLEVPQDHLPIAVIAVHRGQVESAREHSERALALAREQFGLEPPQHCAVLGLAALGERDQPLALEWLGRAEERAAELGWGEPSVRWWTADHVELLLELGRIEEAVALVDAWEADAVRVARPWVLAHAVRCRGLVAAADADIEQAETLLGQAVADHDAVGDPFGSARAMLALGTVRRRARQKRPAREAIESALEAFDGIGASGWAAAARAELGRVGGRTRADGLTPAERRVASLVAAGRTNREVAAALFLGERTVASHLTHVYAKLGVRSRTELAAKLKVQTF